MKSNEKIFEKKFKKIHSFFANIETATHSNIGGPFGLKRCADWINFISKNMFHFYKRGFLMKKSETEYPRKYSHELIDKKDNGF